MNVLKAYYEIYFNNTFIEDHYRIHVSLLAGIKAGSYLKLLEDLNTIESIDYATPSFLIDSGAMFLTNKFFIKHEMSVTGFQKFLDSSSTNFSEVEDYSPGNLFIVNKMINGFETMDNANEINERDSIEYSCPSFSYLIDIF